MSMPSMDGSCQIASGSDWHRWAAEAAASSCHLPCPYHTTRFLLAAPLKPIMPLANKTVWHIHMFVVT